MIMGVICRKGMLPIVCKQTKIFKIQRHSSLHPAQAYLLFALISSPFGSVRHKVGLAYPFWQLPQVARSGQDCLPW